MNNRLAYILAVALLLAGGCAAQRGAVAGPTSLPTATRPADPDAQLTLDQVPPAVELPAPRPAPASQPARPPLEAIELFARARDALIQNQRYTAINLLEKAIRIDPGSYELNYALGRAYASIGNAAEQSIAAFVRAAEIQPNDLEVQAELGRAYQARGDAAKAIERFRLARLTDEYRDGDVLAGVVDYRLAVALQQKGYDRAALECYQSLADRLEHPTGHMRSSPEISYLLTRPQLVYEEIGKLNEKLGDYEQALAAYQIVAEHQENDFDAQGQVVKVLLSLRRQRDAVAEAADLVRKFHASSESISLLRDVYRAAGREGAFADELRRIYRQHTGDRAILFALADTLASSGRADQAEKLLAEAIRQHDGDAEMVQRLFDLYSARDDVADAARLIIQVTAAHPDTTPELTPLFLDLMRLSRKNALRLPSIQKLDVGKEAEASKQYWTWRVASLWTRPATARAALEQSARATPVFDPACRALLQSYWNRSDWDEAARSRAVDALIESVRSRGREDLATELRGIALLQADRNDEAARTLAQAIKLAGNPSPDLQLSYAIAQLKSGNPVRFEQLMWKLLSDRPRFETGYQLLLGYYKQNDALDAKSANLISTWLAADPNSVAARVQEASELIQHRRGAEAKAILHKLFEQRPDDTDVVTSLVVFHTAAGSLDEAISMLEAERARHPNNRVAVEALVEIYAGQKRLDDAGRVLDAARAAVASDPDLLYYIAHLYQRIDRQEMTEQVLDQVLKLDPTHAQAGNDLGYTWADEGKNLARAEQLIRLAIDAEPDNPSYLDSMGWVLYKRGRYADARKYLEQAASPAESADPVVLDHLGDVLYRLDDSGAARKSWQLSLDRLGKTPERDDTRNLREQLQTKLRQAGAGQPVPVAPVADEAAGKAEQAKN